VEKLDRSKEFVLENVETSNIIMDDGDNGNSREGKEKEEYIVSNSKNRGKLIQDILAEVKKF